MKTYKPRKYPRSDASNRKKRKQYRKDQIKIRGRLAELRQRIMIIRTLALSLVRQSMSANKLSYYLKKNPGNSKGAE